MQTYRKMKPKTRDHFTKFLSQRKFLLHCLSSKICWITIFPFFYSLLQWISRTKFKFEQYNIRHTFQKIKDIWSYLAIPSFPCSTKVCSTILPSFWKKEVPLLSIHCRWYNFWQSFCNKTFASKLSDHPQRMSSK